jgi:hypothetical protein
MRLDPAKEAVAPRAKLAERIIDPGPDQFDSDAAKRNSGPRRRSSRPAVFVYKNGRLTRIGPVEVGSATRVNPPATSSSHPQTRIGVVTDALRVTIEAAIRPQSV